jgi:hypothetical protein
MATEEDSGVRLVTECLSVIQTIPSQYTKSATLKIPFTLDLAIWAIGGPLVGIPVELFKVVSTFFQSTPGYVYYLPFVSSSGGACRSSFVNLALDRLQPVADPTLTTKRLAAAGALLLNYKGFRPLPYEVTADQDAIRYRAAEKVVALANVNPTLAIGYLTSAVEHGENDPFTVRQIVRGIATILGKYGNDVDEQVRNQAVAAVDQVATVGASVYGQLAPSTARLVYPGIVKWLVKPAPNAFILPAPVPMPTKQDILSLQEAVNRVAATYQIAGVTVTGVMDAATTEAVVALARKFTAASPLAAQAYVEVVAAPTADTVLALAPRISRDLNALADQLASKPPRDTGSKPPRDTGFRWWYIALPLALVAVGGGTYYALRRYRRTRKPLGNLFICPEEEVGCSGPYPDQQWEDVLRYAEKTGGVSVYRGVRKPDFLIKRF